MSESRIEDFAVAPDWSTEEIRKARFWLDIVAASEDNESLRLVLEYAKMLYLIGKQDESTRS